jgi:hypothetical protein
MRLSKRSWPPFGCLLFVVFLVNPFGSLAEVVAEEATPKKMEMKLHREIELGRWRGTFPCPGDLNHDGRLDFLLYRQGPQTTPGVLAAIDHEGNELWTLGDLKIDHHMPDGLGNEPALRGIALVYDLDQDGRSEVITELWENGTPQLCLLDGATGKIERKIPSPLDLDIRGGRRSRCHPVARVAFLHGKEHLPSLILKYGASGHVPTHAFALDAELDPVWHVSSDGDAMGHVPSVGDVDGDGRDEVLLGTLLVDDDGTELWRQKSQRHADATALFFPEDDSPCRLLMSICSTGPAFCRTADGEMLWRKTTEEVSHGQGIWAGDFLPAEDGEEVIILSSGHRGEYLTVCGSDGKKLAEFTHRREVDGYPDFPCVVNCHRDDRQSLWIPIDRSLVDGAGTVLADLGKWESLVKEKLRWGTTKSHLATQAFPIDVCGDAREELILYQPYHGKSILIFTQADSSEEPKQYVPQKPAYNIHSYF